jgi:hypothetical protein
MLEPSQSMGEPAQPAQILRRVDTIRGDLGELVHELERRSRHAGKELAIAGVVLAVAGIAGVIVWVTMRPKPTRLERLGQAVRRAAAHPERVAEKTPSVSRKVLAAAASATVSVVARQLVRRTFFGERNRHERKHRAGIVPEGTSR